MSGAREIKAEYRIQDIARKGGSAACRVSEIAGYVAGLRDCGQMTKHLEEVARRVSRDIAYNHYRDQKLAALKHDAETKAAKTREGRALEQLYEVADRAYAHLDNGGKIDSNTAIYDLLRDALNNIDDDIAAAARGKR